MSLDGAHWINRIIRSFTHVFGVSMELDISEEVASDDHLFKLWADDSLELLLDDRLEACCVVRCVAALELSRTLTRVLLVSPGKPDMDLGLVCDIFVLGLAIVNVFAWLPADHAKRNHSDILPAAVCS
jgi:hypothetical protein